MRPHHYGMSEWRTLLFAATAFGDGYRRLRSCDRVREEVERSKFSVDRAGQLIGTYLAMALEQDGLLQQHQRILARLAVRGVRSIFDRHDFAFKWSFALSLNVTVPGSRNGLGCQPMGWLVLIEASLNYAGTLAAGICSPLHPERASDLVDHCCTEEMRLICLWKMGAYMRW